MTTLPAADEVLDRFRRADDLIGQLSTQIDSIQAAAHGVARHEQSLDSVATSTAQLASQLEGLRADATAAYGALVAATADADRILSHLSATSEAIAPDEIVRDLGDRLDQLRAGVSDQIATVLAPLETELTGVHQLATEARDALQYIDLSEFQKELDDRLERLERQTEIASTSRQRTEELLTWIDNSQGLQPAHERLAAQARRIRLVTILLVATLILSLASTGLLLAGR